MTKHAKRIMLIAAMALMAPLASLGAASPALATPQGNYAVFAQCPTGTPGVRFCAFVQFTGGEFVIGRMSVPIDKTITLQSGLVPAPEPIYVSVPAKNGESLSKTELNVPGGLGDLIGCGATHGRGIFDGAQRRLCQAVLGSRMMGMTATIEVVADLSNPVLLNLENFLGANGVALTLPIRVHLNNPWLGNGCYIGSESSPIELQLTDGTTSPPEPNKPITGSWGHFSEEEEGLLVDVEDSLVDNAFSVPAAEGCGGPFSSILDPVIDSTLSLPSKAGYNTAILTGTHRLAIAENVIKSEENEVKNKEPEQPGPPPRRHWTGWGPERGRM